MGKLNDVTIRGWIRSGERFEGRSDGDGLGLTWRKRGAPTMANDVLRWVRRMFDHSIKRHVVRFNPAAAFDLSDAGGKEVARDRALPRDELKTFFEAMQTARGFSVENAITVKLLLLLAVREGELIAARWDEFELDADVPVWHLPGKRTKTGLSIDIPLPTIGVEWLRELSRLALGSQWVLPARKMQSRMLPYICESTIGVAMGKVKHGLPHFTTHDFRRTARTHLAALGVDPHVAERCLNHKLKGVEGIYNQHDYLDERKAALQAWGQLLLQFECEGSAKVLPIGRRGESKKVSGHLRGVDPDTRPVAAPGLEPQGMSASIDSPSPVHCTLTGLQSG